VFLMFVLRLRSFNALEEQLRRPGRWERWTGRKKPSADTIGRVMSGLSAEDLRVLLAKIHRQCWRRKAIHVRAGEAYRVVAMDGHELWSSRSRCCKQCSKRTIKVGDHEEAEYYHRVVVAQWIGVRPATIIDLELIRPGEGEVVAARRLLTRILAAHARLIDVISADALYLEAGFCSQVLDAGKHLVVVLKREDRLLYQDAERLKTIVPFTLLVEGQTKTRLWDLPGLETFTTLGRPVRVIWTEQERSVRKQVGPEVIDVVEKSEWAWVADPSVIPPTKIRLWGHDRWDIENRGFNELSNLWHMDHCYVHDPTAIETLLLTLALAFLLSFLFYERNLKEPVRRHLNRLSFVTLFAEGLLHANTSSLWPAPFG